MERHRIKSRSFSFFETKWSKLGKNSAEFLVSFSIGLVVCILEAIFIAIQKIALLVWRFIKRPEPVRAKTTQKICQQTNLKPLNRSDRVLILMELLDNQPIEDNMDIGAIVDLTEGLSKDDLEKIVQHALSTKTGLLACASDFISSINTNIVKG